MPRTNGFKRLELKQTEADLAQQLVCALGLGAQTQGTAGTKALLLTKQRQVRLGQTHRHIQTVRECVCASSSHLQYVLATVCENQSHCAVPYMFDPCDLTHYSNMQVYDIHIYKCSEYYMLHTDTPKQYIYYMTCNHNTITPCYCLLLRLSGPQTGPCLLSPGPNRAVWTLKEPCRLTQWWPMQTHAAHAYWSVL